MATLKNQRRTSSDAFTIEKKDDYKVSIIWKIKNFSSTATKADKKIISPMFSCADADWNVYIFPNGTREFKNVGEVSVFLKRVRSPTTEHEIIFDFDVIDEHQNKLLDLPHRLATFSRNEPMWLFYEINRSDLLRETSLFLSQDTFTVSFDLTVIKNDSSDAISAKDNYQKAQGKSKRCIHCLKPGDFESLYNNPRFSDVTLLLGQIEIPAHKVVLGSRSKVFEAMFEHNMKGSQTRTVRFDDMEATVIEDMLRYMYCGDIRQLSPGDAIGLYLAAGRFDLQELLKICRKIVLESISMNSVCAVATVADLYDDTQLKDAVKSFLTKNIKTLVKTKKWEVFSKQKPALSVKLLESVILTE